jgi:hypothetical protein
MMLPGPAAGQGDETTDEEPVATTSGSPLQPLNSAVRH